MTNPTDFPPFLVTTPKGRPKIEKTTQPRKNKHKNFSNHSNNKKIDCLKEIKKNSI